jgi:hypothetical protein
MPPRRPDTAVRRCRDPSIRSQDEANAEHLAHVRHSGERRGAPSSGKLLADREG